MTEPDAPAVVVDLVVGDVQRSALTYARRYSLSAMLGVVSEDDDDGEGAKRKQQAQQPATWAGV